MRVVLIGNYAPDRQESMLRYADMLYGGLTEAGLSVRHVAPRAVLRRGRRAANGVDKWLGHADKYVLGVGELRRAVRDADLVHICDHSNAVYVPSRPGVPWVVTCHDLLAVRGALGDDTDCPASITGRWLQRGILAGLGRARAVACVSEATRRDARRLMNRYPGELALVPNALNHPYRLLDAAETRRRLEAIVPLRGIESYVLHVGSGLKRKNRGVILRALAAAPDWTGYAVFAGEPLDPEMKSLARELGVERRIVEVPGPDNDALEALYNGALALVFPSRFEGFGWPVVEAQACGCPVICSDRDPLPEVAGDAALTCDADDAQAFGRAIVSLATQASLRGELVRRGLENAARYARAAMISRFLALYERVGDRR